MTILEVRTIVDVVVEAIQREILDDVLVAEDVVTEQHIADRYDVARPTAKAAIERLIEVRLLRREGRQPAQVPRLSSAEVADNLWCRTLLEVQAADALSILKRPPTKALELIGRVEASETAKKDAERHSNEIAFQRALVDEVGSQRLSHMHAILMAEAHLYMRYQTPPNASLWNMHRPLLDAIGEGNRLRAREISEGRLVSAAEELGVLGLLHNMKSI